MNTKPIDALTFSMSSQPCVPDMKFSLVTIHAAPTDQKLPQRCEGWKRDEASRRYEAEKKYLPS